MSAGMSGRSACPVLALVLLVGGIGHTQAVTLNRVSSPWLVVHDARTPLLSKSLFGAQELVAVRREANASGHAKHGSPPSHVPDPRRVEHMDFLNSNSFWVLMGCLVLLVGIGIVRLDAINGNLVATNTTEQTIGAQAERDAAGEASFYETRETLHFLVCVVAMNLAMLLWGICQEFVKTTEYREEGHLEKVPGSLVIVFFNRLVSIVFSAVLLRALGKPLFFTGFTLGCLPGISNVFSSWCQYASLDYVSFALQSTAKSAKLLPVMTIGSIRGKQYTILDYAEVLVIVAGLIVFGTETDAKNQPFTSTEVGTILLLGFLILDSVTPHLQDYAFDRHPDVHPLQVTFAMCLSAASLCLALMLVNGSLFTAAGFLWRHPVAVLHILVLSLCSTVSNFLMVHTVKYFGPTVLTMMIATRQMFSVVISDSLFHHQLPFLAIIACVLVLGTVIIRALRILTAPPPLHRVSAPEEERLPGADEGARLPSAGDGSPGGGLTPSAGAGGSSTASPGIAAYYPLFICAMGIHILYCFYSVVQEFLATHTFEGRIFEFPMFVIAVNHTCGSLFAVAQLKLHKQPVYKHGLYLTALPAITVLVATYFQHKALYFIYFPAQTLMKTLKLIPVMLVGRLLKNRTYTWLDYLEGALISALVFYFVWDVQFVGSSLTSSEISTATVGVLMMVGYVFSDSFLSNFEDLVYQATTIDPGQMLFGMELLSGIFAWISLILSGSLPNAVHFLVTHKEAITYVGLQAWASAAGAYTCTLTVRLFGPAVFTLLMMSRQVFSMMFSVIVYKHVIDWVACLCLVVIAFLILTSSLRRVSAQMAAPETTVNGASSKPP